MTYRSQDKTLAIPMWFARKNRRLAGATAYALMNDPRFIQLHRGLWLDQQVTRNRVIPGWADDNWGKEAISLSAATGTVAESAGSGLTAARLFGLPLPLRFQSPNFNDDRVVIELATTVRAQQTKRRTIRLVRLSALTPVDWYGLRLVSAPDLFVQLAGTLGLDDLVKVGDAMVGNWNSGPLCTLDSLKSRANRPHVRNRKIVLSALSLARNDVDSPSETGLRLWMLKVGLPEPDIHPAVHCSATDRIYHPDLGYPEAKLAIEYHGDHHRVSADQWTEDLNRRHALESEGWTVVEVTRRSDLRLIEQSIRRHLGLRA